MELDNSVNRLRAVVAELEKAATSPALDLKTRQIDLFAGTSARNPAADNTLMAKTLDRTIERIENLLQVGGR